MPVKNPIDNYPSMFSMKVMRKEYSLIATVATCGVAVAMCGAYISYMCITKPDLSFRPWSWGNEAAPYQAVGHREVRKFRYPLRHFETDPEIEALKRELGSYRS